MVCARRVVYMGDLSVNVNTTWYIYSKFLVPGRQSVLRLSLLGLFSSMYSSVPSSDSCMQPYPGRKHALLSGRELYEAFPLAVSGLGPQIALQ